jgi:hypothetical protein
MANAVERLFESVLPELPERDRLPWGNPYSGPPPDSELPKESDDDIVVPLPDDETADDVYDRLGGERGFASQEERDAVDGGIRHRGIEAIAFYKSRRFIDRPPYRGRWGIFYLKSGLLTVAQHIEDEYPGRPDGGRKLALEFLRKHEFFHYRADLQTLMLEATLKRQLYSPLRRALRFAPEVFVEEALANREAWDWARRNAVGIAEFAFAFMKLQPDAYARFDEPRLSLAGEWAAMTVDGAPPGSAGRSDLAHWVHATPQELLRRTLCPEYIVTPARITDWIALSQHLPPVIAVEDGEDVRKVLAGRYASLKEMWAATKNKLLEHRSRPSLDFKPWPLEGEGVHSVRLNDNFRAHLRHEPGRGAWTAIQIGPHKAMGHG